MSLLHIIARNYRGASSRVAVRHLSLLINMYESNILIPVETRNSIQVVDRILAKTKFIQCIMAKVSRFARGIWVFWDATVVNLQEALC